MSYEARYKGQLLGGATPAESQGEVYSDEETRIGTWFGKPLYRRCFQLTSPPDSTIVYYSDFTIDNTEKVITYEAILEHSLGTFVSLAIPLSTELSWSTFSRQNQDSTLRMPTIQVLDNRFYSRPVYITVEYTKTTDTAETS